MYINCILYLFHQFVKLMKMLGCDIVSFISGNTADWPSPSSSP